MCLFVQELFGATVADGSLKLRVGGARYDDSIDFARATLDIDAVLTGTGLGASAEVPNPIAFTPLASLDANLLDMQIGPYMGVHVVQIRVARSPGRAASDKTYVLRIDSRKNEE